MITIPSTPPTTTFANVGAGNAFKYQGEDWMKTTTPGRAVRLTDGADVSVAATEVVTVAPGATYTMWP